MKKHLHKGIALLCSAAIAAGMLVGCSSGSSSAAAPGSSSSASASVSNSESGPLFSEPVTLSMLTPSHASWPFQEDWYVVDLIKEYTNVDLKVTAVDTSGFSEKLNLTMASGELPDLMFLTDNTTVQQYAPQGAFINILDHLDKMPNFKAWYEENQQYAANYLSADGGLYQFPQQGVEETERRGWLYRADIFEELGLEMPTNKDEFYDVLVKLKEAYPDSYPLAFRSFAGTMAQMNMIAPSWGTYYLDITDNRYFGYDYDAQEWTFGPTSPEFKEMLEFYNKLYKEGLLLPNFLTIDTKPSITSAASTSSTKPCVRATLSSRWPIWYRPHSTRMSATSSRIPQRFCSALSFPARQNIWTKRLLTLTGCTPTRDGSF